MNKDNKTTFSDIISEFKRKLSERENSRFEGGKKEGGKYLWIRKISDGYDFDADDCHYELNTESYGANDKSGHKYKHVYIELHCEKSNANIYEEKLSKLESEGLCFFSWGKFGFCCRINNKGWAIEDCDDESINHMIDELYQLDELIGDVVDKIKEGRRYWWVTTKSSVWDMRTIWKEGEVEDFPLLNDNGKKHNIPRNYTDVKAGDLVIGYETIEGQPNEAMIVSLIQVYKENDGTAIWLKCMEQLKNPVTLPFNKLKDIPELKNMEYVRNNRGTLYCLTEKEYNFLINMIRIQSTTNSPCGKMINLLQRKNNIILQGAPGTGKTYNTATVAVSLINGINNSITNHQQLMEIYNDLEKKEHRIFFTTFHQSMDYEDFVEGMKPKIQKGGASVTYEVENGIFKIACEKAYIFQFEVWLDAYLQTMIGESNKKTMTTKTGKSQYVWWGGNGSNTIHTRSTQSSVPDEKTANSDIAKSDIILRINGMGHDGPRKSLEEAFIEAVKEYGMSSDFARMKDEFEKPKPVVLIIDEINRGNVSKIFGELISLIEKDKRIGGEHPLSVILPYSKENFSVTDNLYIIGTMNTTDRSTGTLDYALRRRFAFYTMKADESVIEKYYNNKGNGTLGDDAKKLFNNVKEFIEKYNASGDMSIDDLMVGHSYFMASDEDELKDKVEYEVVPLIKEYINDGILNVSSADWDTVKGEWLELKTLNFDKPNDSKNGTQVSGTTDSNN